MKCSHIGAQDIAVNQIISPPHILMGKANTCPVLNSIKEKLDKGINNFHGKFFGKAYQ